jgi:hypothetical protein
MSPGEAARRGQALVRQWWWSAESRRPDLLATVLPGAREARFLLPRSGGVSNEAETAVLEAAEALLRGEWRLFHLRLADLPAEMDWSRDPLTGRRAPPVYCFDVPYRNEDAVGNIKFVWEMSRHQPVTLLACAWWLSGDDRFAESAGAQLRSWWRDNPFLRGVQWISAIEVGLRLLSWSWIRALLADWSGAAALFEHSDVFVKQLYGHCRFLAAFPSTGSSANNHLIAELAGLHAASLCFPFFTESDRWRESSGDALAAAAAEQTYAGGWNKEQASGYHLFVAEVLLAAALPARLLGRALLPVEHIVHRMMGALAASLDAAGRPPRFGDSDDARGLLVDAPAQNATAALLEAGRTLWGAPSWWPAATGSVLGRIASLAAPVDVPAYDRSLPDRFVEAGIAILRAGDIWLRCDDGPHGYGSLAAHGHADALSVELRVDGVEVLADPGTYCYHGEATWRSYFRGTSAHNTLQVGGKDQARTGGPFLWLDHPRSRCERWESGRLWQASHDGYRNCTHHRQVELTRGGVVIQDWLTSASPQPVVLFFHLGPEVSAQLSLQVASLHFRGRGARMLLPADLHWTLHRGETAPPLGWYSSRFGERQPVFTLRGSGTLPPELVLTTTFDLLEGLGNA